LVVLCMKEKLMLLFLHHVGISIVEWTDNGDIYPDKPVNGEITFGVYRY